MTIVFKLYTFASYNKYESSNIDWNKHTQREKDKVKTVTLCKIVRVDSKPVWVGWTSTELLPVVQFWNYNSSSTELRL